MENIASIPGGSVVAMAGDECVAIATDHIIVCEGDKYDFDFGNMFKVHPFIYMAISGCQEDIIRLRNRMLLRKNMFGNFTPEIYAQNLSNYLKEPRLKPYQVESVVAGLNTETVMPFICGVNTSGELMNSKDFSASGKCPAIGTMCKALWKPDLKPSDLLTVISDSIMDGSDLMGADCWGATIYVVHKTSEKIVLLPKN
ncbi:proteasome subunit beta type-3-like [Drosophila miranda]|uniref:proteasome subunit beta type-3-like n=1 Tax=Drosophila miranda TaxID=7229 RepID=UPI0007E85C73|nr:proteasome subunit beta type-3-like [Drosophila miranda]XP_017156673.1 proteasome subunit beta type-3-like [Drosophila miranda]XP_017156674.1 proteasome subunit beta type-3-like [Drosophila miranda]